LNAFLDSEPKTFSEHKVCGLQNWKQRKVPLPWICLFSPHASTIKQCLHVYSPNKLE